MLKIKWFGHSMWRLSTDNCNIIIDPFNEIGFPMVANLTADIVISSHEHADHAYFKSILPPFQKITQIGTYQVKGVTIKMIESSHNARNLNDNYMSLIMIEGMTALHCGDLGLIPDPDKIAIISDVDILFVPIGGKYTIDALTAKKFIELVHPKIVFPMHYRLDKSTIEIDSIEPFAKLYDNMETIETDIFEISKETMPTKPRIIRMKYE